MKERTPPWKPVDYDLATIGALQALSRGEATAHQQKVALAWIVREAADWAGVAYHTDPHDTAFASGRRFVAVQIQKLVDMPAQVKEAMHERSSNGNVNRDPDKRG
ncbi:MAG: hypothetical protein ACPG61_13950 [Paracoccaceae bacterium]